MIVDIFAKLRVNGKNVKETGCFLKQVYVHNIDMVDEVLTLWVTYSCDIAIAPIRKHVVEDRRWY